MRFIEFLVLILLFVALITGLYFLWLNLPTESIEFKEYKQEISREFPLESIQFYNRMRFPKSDIGYRLEPECSKKKQNDFIEAVTILEQKTILTFHRSDTPEITVFCSNIVPKADQENHFIAGEGGPTEIINSSRYAVILSGEISLYRIETCDSPQVSVHELLHALGFNHNSNEDSIMYPITDCSQEIDQALINTINELYKEPSQGDLSIESIKANKTGRYLNFNIQMTNEGLKKIDSSILVVIIGGVEIAEYEIKELDIGTKRFLSVKNQRIPRNTNEIRFVLRTTQPELSLDNNEAIITIVT